jgi:hypothetical protein
MSMPWPTQIGPKLENTDFLRIKKMKFINYFVNFSQKLFKGCKRTALKNWPWL